MTRPLVISDCDEVLLHMVEPLRLWLDSDHDIHFDLSGGNFANSMSRRASGEPLASEEIWPILRQFFDNEMHRQYPIEGAVNSLASLAEHADLVVLTNLGDDYREARTRQLAEHGIHIKVYTNQGPKGPALQAILDEYAPGPTVFIDDIAHHHDSVAAIAPRVSRLHLCGEPKIAPHIACAHKAGHAHARIDDWANALPWILGRLYEQTHD